MSDNSKLKFKRWIFYERIIWDGLIKATPGAAIDRDFFCVGNGVRSRRQLSAG